ncbi:MAG: Crp/Fnr family transcriptional regulator [Breznakibacter sp.]
MKTISAADQEFVCDINVPCFQALSAEEAELVRQGKTQVMFRKGENLTKQGAFSTYVLFVISGLVKQYIEGDGTRDFNLCIIRPGEFVGLSAAFGRSMFDYSTLALTETQVFLVEKDALIKVAQSNSDFSYRIAKRYGEQNSMLYETIRNLMYKQTNGRMADTLLYLQNENFGGKDVTSLLTRKDIADFAGISTEGAVKVLKSFEKDGYIKLEDRHIEILDKNALAEISKRG